MRLHKRSMPNKSANCPVNSNRHANEATEDYSWLSQDVEEDGLCCHIRTWHPYDLRHELTRGFLSLLYRLQLNLNGTCWLMSVLLGWECCRSYCWSQWRHVASGRILEKLITKLSPFWPETSGVWSTDFYISLLPHWHSCRRCVASWCTVLLSAARTLQACLGFQHRCTKSSKFAACNFIVNLFYVYSKQVISKVNRLYILVKPVIKY